MADSKGRGVTLPGCDAYLGRKEYVVSKYGTLCMEPAAEQNRLLYAMPTVKSWSRDLWYVWLIIGIIVILCSMGCAFQSFRWYRRIKHRHERGERCRRTSGMLFLMSSLSHKRTKSASQGRSEACPSPRLSESPSESPATRDVEAGDSR
ncbi:hypothetical_protein [Leishmania infantum]|uniref:Hypothetical_protein n=1 Tax=Leishmania infantum TaxID=5671 RepID=A0A6L0WNC9_LEIIN|nr:hypothetical_protein [Leishmania infantum]SUZ40177.1 hypothetical_protein [Leishmania infantum]